MQANTLQLLPRGRLALALALAVLFVGAVAAVGAAGDGAEHAVMAGIMAGDAADRGAFQAAFGVGGGGYGREGCDGEEGGEGFHGGAPVKVFGLQRLTKRQFPDPPVFSDALQRSSLTLRRAGTQLALAVGQRTASQVLRAALRPGHET